jgi:hypothetical protein
MGNEETHPLPRGGTDLIGTVRCTKGKRSNSITIDGDAGYLCY